MVGQLFMLFKLCGGRLCLILALLWGSKCAFYICNHFAEAGRAGCLL